MFVIPSVLRVVFLLFGLTLLAGCSDGRPETYPIPGKLVYDDGSPVPGGSVVLQTTVGEEVVSARGMAAPDGRFTLTTFDDQDGVVAGEHDVSISPIPLPEGTKPAGPPVPEQYWDFSTSGLKTTVTPETKEMVITLHRGGAK